jgi:hypothetical protein
MLARYRQPLHVVLSLITVLSVSGLFLLRPVQAQDGTPPFPLDATDVIVELDPNAVDQGGQLDSQLSIESTAAINVSINTGVSVGVSHYTSGISHVDDSLVSGNTLAVSSARNIVGNSTDFENTHLMAWGVADPWPDPTRANPYNWTDMDTRVSLMVAKGNTPIITLAEAPWWMKGRRQADGSVLLIPDVRGEWEPYTYTTSFTDYRGIRYPAGYVSPSPIAARVLDSEMDNWLKLVQATAERYMAPPYNVRYFQVWNELKGYYNPSTNRWDYDTSAGNTTGRHAEHGYTYMYNRAYQRVRLAATNLGIPLNQIKIGGPYIGFKTWADSNVGGYATTEPLLMNKPYGTYDQRDVDALKYWLANKTGAEFITWDGGTKNREGINLVGPYAAAEKFYDTVTWLRSLNPTTYPGATTLPVSYAEWYAFPYDTTSPGPHNSVKTYSAIRFIQAGGWLTLLWGGEQRSIPQLNASLYTETSRDGGGQALSWAGSYQALKTYFGAGTVLVKTTQDSSNIAVLASAAKTLLVNKTSSTLTVLVNGVSVTLNAYQVLLMNTPGGGGAVPTATQAPAQTSTPGPTATRTQAPTATPSVDTVQPNVSVDAPNNGGVVLRNTTVGINGSASDNVGIRNVKFFVNNTQVCADDTAPYQCAWAVPGGAGIQYTLRVQAIDTSGNKANASITVTSK